MDFTSILASFIAIAIVITFMAVRSGKKSHDDLCRMWIICFRCKESKRDFYLYLSSAHIFAFYSILKKGYTKSVFDFAYGYDIEIDLRLDALSSEKARKIIEDHPLTSSYLAPLHFNVDTNNEPPMAVYKWAELFASILDLQLAYIKPYYIKSS